MRDAVIGSEHCTDRRVWILEERVMDILGSRSPLEDYLNDWEHRMRHAYHLTAEVLSSTRL